jgi:HYR domain-containing protein
VTCTSTDTHGNLGSATFTVTVVDTTPPALTLPPTITALPASAAGAAVTFAASAADLVSGAVAVTCAPASGSIFAIGTTTVACSARDTHGNVATGTFTVVVLSPAQIVANLIADVTAADFRQALKLLQNVLASLSRTNPAAACGQVNAFINQVRAQAGKKLSADEADRLIQEATQLAAALACPAPA